MKNQFLILVILWVSIGCNKQPRASYWTVNNENFSTYDVNYGHSFGGASLATLSHENGFSIFLAGGSLPRQGTFTINNVSQGQSYHFYYNGKNYIPAVLGITEMQASENNGKAILTIPPTWFFRIEYDSASTILHKDDSVLIQAVLSEP